MAKTQGVVFVSAVLLCLCSASYISPADAAVLAKKTTQEVGIRSALQLGLITPCVTGLNLVEVGFDYNGYGCYCGLGGDGSPLDETDTCCYIHDNCYKYSGCSPKALVYTILYIYSFSGCGTDDVSISCQAASNYPWYYSGETRECAETICNCDKAMAFCFKATRSTYDVTYRNWSNSKC